MKITLFYLVLLVSILTSCGPSIQLIDISEAKLKVDEDKSKVILFRKSWLYWGAAFTYFVREDKKEIGYLVHGSYLSWETEPGVYSHMQKSLT